MEGKDTEGVKEKFSDVRSPLHALVLSLVAHTDALPTDVLPFVPLTTPSCLKLTILTAALISNWKVWPLAQAVNFSLMPLAYRVPCVSLVVCFH